MMNGMRKHLRRGAAALVVAGVALTGAGVHQANAAEGTIVNRTYILQGQAELHRIATNNGISLDELYAELAKGGFIWPGMTLDLPADAPKRPQAGQQTQTPPAQTPGNGGAPANEAPSGPAEQPAVSQSQFASEVVDLVNAERAKAGLGQLSVDALLTKVATDKAADMDRNQYFSHESPTYGSPFDMMRAYGVSYSYAGENIAKGQRSPEEVMNAWMNSEGHRANILNGNFTKIGVAYVNGVWVQSFTG